MNIEEQLHKQAIKEAFKLLADGEDFQVVIEKLFNDSDIYNALFNGMNEDERFQEAHDIVVEAEPEV